MAKQTPEDAFSRNAWFDYMRSGSFLNLASSDEARRFRAAYRQAVMNRDGTITGSRLEAFVDATLPRFRDSIVTHFKNARNAEEMTDSVTDFSVANATRIDNAIQAFNQYQRNQVFGDQKSDSTQALTGREPQTGKLRTRYDMVGSNTLEENWQDELADQALFKSFVNQTPNQTGEYNSIFLRNEQHDELMSRNAAMPRSSAMLEQLVGTSVVPEMYQGSMNMLPVLVDKTKDLIVQHMVTKGPNISFALHDQEVYLDPITGYPIQTILEPVIASVPDFVRDVSQGTSAAYQNAFGMRNIYDTYRQIFVPPIDNTVETQPRSLQSNEMRGFDYLYNAG